MFKYWWLYAKPKPNKRTVDRTLRRLINERNYWRKSNPRPARRQEESKLSETQHLSHSQISTYMTCPLRYKSTM